jgi:L-glutamine-phosphate cytidylyltransferase
MGRYTDNLPKGMLSIHGKSLIEWQVKKLRAIGLTDIAIVTGYRCEAIAFCGITYYHNPDWADTNMVETLMCAREALSSDVLVCYSDILYTRELAQMASSDPVDMGVSVDAAWRDYWTLRFGSTEEDLETLTVSPDGQIVELGRPAISSEGLGHRYIGLLKFSRRGAEELLRVYDLRKAAQAVWPQSGKPFRQGYMTDLLHQLIVAGAKVMPIITRGGWMEFDTAQDYELACRLHSEGKAKGLFE